MKPLQHTSILAICFHQALSFSPLNKGIHHLSPPSTTRTLLDDHHTLQLSDRIFTMMRTSSSLPTKLYSSPLRTANEEMKMKQQVAKEALQKLLARQQKEIRDTEALLINLENMSNDKFGQSSISGSNSTLMADAKYEALLNAPSIASSLIAAFDYGFISRSEGCRFEDVDDFNEQLFRGYGPPANIFSLGSQQFMRNLNAMKGEYRDEDDVVLTKKQRLFRQKLEQLTLNSTAIWERERSRGEIVAPLIIKVPYYVLCYLLDVVFEGKYVPSRFFLLETVARMPYFSYIAMLHLYETLGFWRRSKDVKRVHFAEEWNEFHHLLIMESLGGDQSWWVRFMAQHSAIAYYIVLSVLFAISPSLSYKFSELLETHAVDTYGQFLDENEELLKELPPSLAAVEYYTAGVSDPMFGEYQTSAIASGTEIRKPGTNMTTLYDVFFAIRSDEGDHVGTMKACLDPKIPVISPSLEVRLLTGLALSVSLVNFLQTDDLSDVSPELLGVTESLPIAEPFLASVIDRLSTFFENFGVEDLDTSFLERIGSMEGFDQAMEVLLNLIRTLGLL